MPVKLKEFATGFEAFTSTLMPQAYSIVVRKTMLDLLTRVVDKTPVKTGRARGNWQIAIDSIAGGDTGREDEDGDETIAAGSQVLGGFNPLVNEFVSIANNVPYILVLENGSSKVQAPNGMLAISLEEIAVSFS